MIYHEIIGYCLNHVIQVRFGFGNQPFLISFQRFASQPSAFSLLTCIDKQRLSIGEGMGRLLMGHMTQDTRIVWDCENKAAVVGDT